MPVLLRQSRDLPEPSAYESWFAVTGATGRGPDAKRVADLASKLETAFNHICPEWWTLARALADDPGAELSAAATCSGYGSDFGLMMAWGRLGEELAGDKDTHLVVCDDPWLFRHLAAAPAVEADKFPPLWPTILRLRLRGLLARTRLVGRLVWAVLACRRQRAAHGPGDPVILVYGHPRSNAEGYDDYFGPMMTELPGLKRALHTDCGVGAASSLAADGRTASLHAWGSPWRALGLLFRRWRPARQRLEGRYGWLVRRAAEWEAGGGAHAMNAWQRLCQEAWLAQARPSVVAWPWENHGWERGFCRAARALGVATVGYQHTVIGPHQLNYSPAVNRDGIASLPDTVVADGPAYRDQLAAWGVPTERLVIGGSLRIHPPEGDVYDADAPCFVALSARLGIARQQMSAVEAAAGEGFQFLVGVHPMYTLDFRETARIRRARGKLAEQSSLSAVFYGTGTSGLEALLAGLPTFRLLPEDEIALDVLPPSIFAVPVSVDGLAGALARATRPPRVAWDDVLAPVDWPLWHRLLSAETAPAAAEPGPMQREKIA